MSYERADRTVEGDTIIPKGYQKAVMDIRLITRHEMTQVKELILDVFMKYEAPDYGEQGVLTFREIVINSNYKKPKNQNSKMR